MVTGACTLLRPHKCLGFLAQKLLLVDFHRILQTRAFTCAEDSVTVCAINRVRTATLRSEGVTPVTTYRLEDPTITLIMSGTPFENSAVKNE